MNHKNAFDVVSNLLGDRLTNMLFAELDDASLAIYKKREEKTKRRPRKAAPMSDAIRLGIIRDHLTTDMTQSQIAAKYKINSGRVAETLEGITAKPASLLKLV